MASNYLSTHLKTIEPDTYWSSRSSNDPVDVEFDIDGNILVCNSTDEILKFNQSGQFMSRFSVGYDREVNGMSCNKSGEIFMTDDNTKEVIVCDDEGQITFDFSVSEALDQPNKLGLGGIVVSEEDDSVFVVDTEKSKVIRLTKDGELMNKIRYGDFNPGKGTLHRPRYVALDNNKNVLVNDAAQRRVQVYRPDGQFVRSLRGCRCPGTSPEFFNQPTGIAVFGNGHVVVGCVSGLYACQNISYGPIIRRFDDKNSENGIVGTEGIATYGNLMAVAITERNVESTIELFKYDS